MSTKKTDQEHLLGSAYLKLHKENIEIPILNSSESLTTLDARLFSAQSHRLHFYDPGALSFCTCKSAISEIDAENGRLFYAGYDISELVAHADFIDVALLLLNKELPDKKEKKEFLDLIDSNNFLEPEIITLIKTIKQNDNMIAMLSAAFSILWLKSPISSNPMEEAALLLAKAPIVFSALTRRIQDKHIISPISGLSYIDNLIHMLGIDNASTSLIRALEIAMILHADHSQNLSTSVCRNVRSGQAGLFPCIIAGMCALSGSAHGGANKDVWNMLKSIQDKEENIDILLAKAEKKEIKLPGFGHRVYKKDDPRAVIMESLCQDIGISSDPLSQIAHELKRKVYASTYFQERNIYMNVDFISTLILQRFMPKEAFTSFFAISRLIGWISQAIELGKDSEQKIFRPSQIYTGKPLGR